MEKQNKNFVILFNIWTIVVITLQTYVLGNVVHFMNIIRNPLFVTETCLVSFTLWHLMGFHGLQNFQPISVGNLIRTSAWAVMSSFIFHIMAVVYGIPVSESVSETYHLSCLLTVLAVIPNLCVIGTNMESWLRLYTLNKPETLTETSVQTTTVCSIVGAWLGAFPIPLDWDRPWQVWPISCLIGTLAGYVVGLVIACNRVNRHDAVMKKIKLG